MIFNREIRNYFTNKGIAAVKCKDWRMARSVYLALLTLDDEENAPIWLWHLERCIKKVGHWIAK